MAQTYKTLTLGPVPNQAPVYTGPDSFNNLNVGESVQLTGTDDQGAANILWEITEGGAIATITTTGLLTRTSANVGNVVVRLKDSIPG